MDKDKKTKKESFFFSKKGFITMGISAAVLIIIFALMLIESTGKNKIVIKNNTDLKLEYVKLTFVNTEGALMEPLAFKNIASNKTGVYAGKDYYLTNLDANMEVRFKFENYDEIFTDAGIFNGILKGKIALSFDQKDSDTVNVKIKASNGLFADKNIDCNETYTAHLKEGLLEQ